MVTCAKPLLALTAADLMSEPVVTVSQEMSLHQAAHLLSQAHVSGAPVVDYKGRCVGVLSAGDFITLADKGPLGAMNRQARCACICADWQFVEGELLPEDTVGNYMTADPVTVTAATPIGELTRKMLDAHIHRLIVTDQAGRPVGIVSSTDVLAAVARAADFGSLARGGASS